VRRRRRPSRQRKTRDLRDARQSFASSVGWFHLWCIPGIVLARNSRNRLAVHNRPQSQLNLSCHLEKSSSPDFAATFWKYLTRFSELCTYEIQAGEARTCISTASTPEVLRRYNGEPVSSSRRQDEAQAGHKSRTAILSLSGPELA
jgi:hypothetical protein